MRFCNFVFHEIRDLSFRIERDLARTNIYVIVKVAKKIMHRSGTRVSLSRVHVSNRHERLRNVTRMRETRTNLRGVSYPFFPVNQHEEIPSSSFL